MNEPRESFETIAGCKVHVLRGGRGSPLLFLHGGRGAGVWLPLFKALSEHFDVIVPEHPGFGRSDMPGRGLTFDWIAATIDRFTEVVGFDRYAVRLQPRSPSFELSGLDGEGQMELPAAVVRWNGAPRKDRRLRA